MDLRAARSRQDRDRQALSRMRLRQLALFAAILISGGLIVIPRVPLLVLVLIICFALKNPLRLLSSEFAVVWTLLIATAAAALLGGESFQPMSLAIRYGNFLGGLALLALYIDERPGQIADDLHPILRLLAFQAVITPVLALAVPGLFWTFEAEGAIYETIGYVFTFHEIVAGATFFKRPDGFFFEPGVFQIYLSAYLFICLFLRRFSPFEVGLATLAVIATQSTTGAVILVVLFGAVYLRWLRTAGRVQKLGLFILAPALLLPIATYTTINLAEKFYGQSRGSADAREYDLRTGINVALEHPLTGIGFEYERYFEVASRVGFYQRRLSEDNVFERPNSNGIVTVFYTVGIPLALIFVWGLFRQRFMRPRWLFGGVMIISLLSEALFYTPFFLMLTFSGLLIRRRQRRARASRVPAGDPRPRQVRSRPELQPSGGGRA